MKKSAAEKLNPYLSDLVVMFLKLHDLHWNVRGKMFVQVHEYTEARYDDLAAKFDEVAEKIIMAGEKPVTGMKDYQKLAQIEELNKGQYGDEEVLRIVLKDLKHLKEEAVSIRAAFAEDDVFSVTTMLEDHILGYEKEIWFLESMLG